MVGGPRTGLEGGREAARPSPLASSARAHAAAGAIALCRLARAADDASRSRSACSARSATAARSARVTCHPALRAPLATAESYRARTSRPAAARRPRCRAARELPPSARPGRFAVARRSLLLGIVPLVLGARWARPARAVGAAPASPRGLFGGHERRRAHCEALRSRALAWPQRLQLNRRPRLLPLTAGALAGARLAPERAPSSRGGRAGARLPLATGAKRGHPVAYVAESVARHPMPLRFAGAPCAAATRPDPVKEAVGGALA